MRTLKRSKPKTISDRATVAGSAVAAAGKAVGAKARASGQVVAEGSRTARDRALSRKRSEPSGLETTRGKAIAAAGAAGAAAGAVAFWRRAQGAPDIKVDPAKPEPTSVVTTETPEAKAAKEAAPAANGGAG